jgi:hypothetical protein
MAPKREHDERSPEHDKSKKRKSSPETSGTASPESHDEAEQPAPAPLVPNATPVGESRDNLRARQEWFRRRSGGS